MNTSTFFGNRRFMLAALGFSLLLAGCERDKERKPTMPPDAPPQETVELFMDSAQEAAFDQRSRKFNAEFQEDLLDPYLQPCIAVCRSEHDWLTAQYAKNFALRTGAGHIEVPDPVILAQWSDFKSKVLAKKPDGKPRGVVFHFGLTPQNRFALGMNVVIMEQPLAGLPWTYDESKGTFYVVKEDDIDPMDRADWNEFETRYRDNVLVSRDGSGGNFASLDACDHLAYFMPWELEIFHLGEDNKPGTGAKVAFSCGAMDFTWQDDGSGTTCPLPKSLRQTMIIHIDGQLNNNRRQEANEPILLGRGIDLGTPCPPRCRKWAIPEMPNNCVERDRCAQLEL